jgi:HTH-type transcriptional regulator/antitoxin MqsA
MKSAKKLCPLCESCELREKTITKEFFYKQQRFVITDYIFLYCRDCDEEFVSLEHEKKFAPIIRDEQRKIDGLLTSSEIKQIRRILGITQKEMSQILGGGEKSFARYENGTVSQSRAMDTMLRLLAENPALINQLRNNGSHFSAKWQSLGKACLQSSPCRTEKLNGSSKRISKTDFFSINPEDNSWCLA